MGGLTRWGGGALIVVEFEPSIGSEVGSNPVATSLVMHESGHVSGAWCPAIADDPGFDKTITPQRVLNVNNRAERFATAFAIAHGAPDREGAGEWAYKIGRAHV